VAAVMVILPLPVIVKAPAVHCQALVDVPLMVHVPVPRDRVRVVPLVLVNLTAVTLYPLALNVPDVSVSELAFELENASANCTVPPAASMVMVPENTTPALVITAVPLRTAQAIGIVTVTALLSVRLLIR